MNDPGLNENTSQQLGRYQYRVDSANTYPERVRKAIELFRRYNQRSNDTFRVIRATLEKMCYGVQRCTYCEDSVGDEIEHIKPKDLFPEDSFVWENYLLSCGICNRSKSNCFSIVDDEGSLLDVTRRHGDAICKPPLGRPALVDPRLEDPLDFFHLDIMDTFFFLPGDDLTAIDLARSEYTINLLKLNRDALLRARRQACGDYRARLVEYIGRRNDGASGNEIEALRNGILHRDHPTVWREMQRQSRRILRILFADAPEALEWRHVVDAAM